MVDLTIIIKETTSHIECRISDHHSNTYLSKNHDKNNENEHRQSN